MIRTNKENTLILRRFVVYVLYALGYEVVGVVEGVYVDVFVVAVCYVEGQLIGYAGFFGGGYRFVCVQLGASPCSIPYTDTPIK